MDDAIPLPPVKAIIGKKLVHWAGGHEAAAVTYRVSPRKMQRFYSGNETMPYGLACEMLDDLGRDDPETAARLRAQWEAASPDRS